MKKTLFLINKVVSTFKGRPLLHLEQFLYGECIACYNETHKIQVNVLKLRLHYNELAQRTATVLRYLTFVDIRWYTLKKSDECDH